ncbi:MAG: hypothetical protein HONBIEJF_00979 [Fimbriimonadaceae bacterium]|nr:hypothetical protein [Fimbriimonadaceae bacterium]
MASLERAESQSDWRWSKIGGMTDERFWELIDKCRSGTGPLSPSAEPERLAEVLQVLSDGELTAFGSAFYHKLCDLNTWPLWGAGYVLAGGMSGDGFHYFRSWIIGKGEAAFKVARSDPDGISAFVEDDCALDNELLEYVATEIADERGLPDPRDAEEHLSPDDEPSGESWDEDTVHLRYPKCLTVARRIGNWV